MVLEKGFLKEDNVENKEVNFTSFIISPKFNQSSKELILYTNMLFSQRIQELIKFHHCSISA